MGWDLKFWLTKIRNWLPKAQNQLQVKATELEAQVNKESLNPLPYSQLDNLNQKIALLPIPPIYLELISSKISETIERWQENDNAPNSLVILGSPNESFEQIFTEVLDNWQQEKSLQLQSFGWHNRPDKHSQIKSEFISEIEKLQHQEEEEKSNSFKAIAIPDLSKCFLRCVDGLDTIEYLEELLFKDRSQFWLIGCNTWAWKYLDVVCHVSDYFTQTLFLPELKDFEIKQWLNPVTKTIDFEYNYESNESDESDEEQDSDNWDSPLEKSYFEDLARISLGLGPVASRLWLLSFGTEKEDEEDEAESTSNNDRSQSTAVISQRVFLQKATFPNLPTLSQNERYLLFSLCIHQQMTLSQLALSLGETKMRVQNQVQNLSTLGIVEKKQQVLTINPAHYPQLKRDLTNNNFLIAG